MTTKIKARVDLKGRARLRAEIVEIVRDQHALGMVTDEELDQTTMRMLGRDALPKVARLTPKEIVRVREVVKVSQAVLAGFLNVSVSTVSQWERGDRQPSGAALKLLHVVKSKGLDALR